MVRPTKKEQIPNLSQAIKETAWRQIAETGAAALSLRAIARELNITAPAIYNYFPRRDDLVTALIVDAFTSLGESQTESLRNSPDGDLKEQISSLGLAYRTWAIKYPQRYQLIFGTPIPNYEAPVDITAPVAAESLVPLIKILQAGLEANLLRVERSVPMTSELRSMLEEWSQFTGGFDLEVLYITLVIWSRVHGLVSLEIGYQFPRFISDPGELYRHEIAIHIAEYIRE